MFDRALFSIGYMMTPLLRGFCEWVMENSEHPVKLSMRSSEPFSIVASHLYKSDKKKYFKLSKWNEIYLNRTLTERMSKSDGKILCDYAKQNGLGRPYTFVDIGYRGTIVFNLTEAGFAPKQVLQMHALDGGIHSGRGYLNEKLVDPALIENDTDGELHRFIHTDQSMTHDILHNIPKVYKKMHWAVGKEPPFKCGRSGKVKPIQRLSDNRKYADIFYSGVKCAMSRGYDDWLAAIRYFMENELIVADVLLNSYVGSSFVNPSFERELTRLELGLKR